MERYYALKNLEDKGFYIYLDLRSYHPERKLNEIANL